MNIQAQVNQQRVQYIVSSYHLDGEETASCKLYLEKLLQHYPTPLIELALVETLIDRWLTLSSWRGVPFFEKTHHKLKTWEKQPIISTVTPAQFRQITNLDPAPIFNNPELPPPRSVVENR